MCVCIDDNWNDASGASAPGPKVGAICVVEKVFARGGTVWLSIKGYNNLMEASGFRPARLSEIIVEFRQQEAAHAAQVTDGMTYEAEEALISETYGPSLDALCDAPPATSPREAAYALELALEQGDMGGWTERLVRSALVACREN